MVERTFRASADALYEVIGTTVPELQRITEQEANRPPATPTSDTARWSVKQILGHLLDSAANNHQRFVRAALYGRLEAPGYEQDRWIALERPEGIPWRDLVAFWTQYNRYLAHLMAQLPRGAAEAPVVLDASPSVTLAFIASDYVEHLKHHINQIIGPRFPTTYAAKG